MKLKTFIFLFLTIVLIFLLQGKVNASTPSATLTASKTKLEEEETFTVTLNAKADEGISAVIGKIVYDSNALELQKTDIVNTFFSIGEGNNIELICNSTNKITNVNVCTFTFKVKKGAIKGSKQIKYTDAQIDTDESQNSLKSITVSPISVEVIEKLYVVINSYQENNNYLTNIKLNETLQNLINNVNTNGNLALYKDLIKVTALNTKLSTGMKLNIGLNDDYYEKVLVVRGDVNGDGEANINDILQINKHRLGKITLTNEYLLAGDVNNDNVDDIKDILQINKFRLGKITSL